MTPFLNDHIVSQPRHPEDVQREEELRLLSLATDPTCPQPTEEQQASSFVRTFWDLSTPREVVS